MKCLALVYLIVSILFGWTSARGEYLPPENGDFYIGVGGSVVESLPIGNTLQAIQAVQIAGSNRRLLQMYDVNANEGNSVQLLLGLQVTKVLDLEAAVYTNNASALTFSGGSQVEVAPSFSRQRVFTSGDLRQTGAMLTTIWNWNFHQYFSLFARVGASYDSTTLTSELTSDPGTVFINQVQYRAKDIQPVWGGGIRISDAVSFEYQVRKLPIGSTASKQFTAADQSFDASIAGDDETLRAFMITIRLRFKNFSFNQQKD